MKEITRLFLSLFFLVTVHPAAGHEGHGHDGDTAFASIFHHYEAVWEVLTRDATDGLAEHAEGIREAAERIVADFDAAKAGLESDVESEKAVGFFQAVAKAATDLGSATEIAWAREAFYDLSKPMVRLNEHSTGGPLKVVYCSMAKKSWLQRSAEIANPYHGQAMAGCGEIVSS